MFSSIYYRAKEAFRRYKQRQVRPLRSIGHDFKLLQNAKKCSFPKWHQLVHINKILKPAEKVLFVVSIFVLLWGLVWAGLNFLNNYRIIVPVNGGSYEEAVVGAPQYVNPIFASTNDADMDIVRLVYSGLMRYDEKYRLIPDLAVKYTVSEDKKVYTFELRKDVVWQDGEKFTANDVVYTIETIQNPLVGSPLFVSFQGVAVSALDDYTVQFVLQESFNSFLSILTVGILPEHLWFEVLPEQMRLAKINLQPIGTGPFKFKKFLKDDVGHIYSYEVERFDKYYRQPAYLDSFVFSFYPEYDGDSGAIKAFREQKTQGLNFVPHALLDRVARKNIILHKLELPQYTALFFNQDNSAFLKDYNLRLALAESLDKERIVREVLQQNATVIDGPILPGFPGYSVDLKKIDFSFDEANKLLDKNWSRITAEDYKKSLLENKLKEWEEKFKAEIASSTASSTIDLPSEKIKVEEEIKKEIEGNLQAAQTFYRKNKSGDILEIDLVTLKNKEYEQAVGLIAGFWETIGVKTNIKLVEMKDFSRDVLKNRSYDVLLYGEIIGADPDPYPFWHSSQINYPGFNLAKYVNRSVDAVIEKIRGGVSEEEQINLYRKYQETLLSELPAIFLYMPTYTYATYNDIKGIVASRISYPSDRLNGVVNWYIKTKKRWNF